MESGGYGSAHLSSPALVVFSQAAASGLSEAFRLQQQRPFHNSQVQMPDPKDLHHLSLVGSYGAHLLHGFPPHFLHSSLSSNLAGNGANPSFGSNGAFVKPFPSAFAPPKCISALSSMEQSVMFGGGSGPGSGGGGGANESFRTSESSSPACHSMSPPVKEESMEGHTSEDGDHRDRICTPERSPDNTPGFRRVGHPPNKNNKQISLHMNLCPVCGIQLSPAELDSHFLTELDRLYKLTSPAERQRLRASLSGMMGPNGLHNAAEMSMHMSNGTGGPGSRWETFNRIRSNRQNRLRAKTRKRKGDSESDFPSPPHLAQCQSCPVCHGRLQRTPEEITQHIEDCIKKSGQNYPHLGHLSHSKAMNGSDGLRGGGGGGGGVGGGGGTNSGQSGGGSSNNNHNNNNHNQDEDETVDVESYGDDASTTSSTTNNNNNNNHNSSSSHHHHHHSDVPPAHSSGGSSMSLKLIEHQTIPSISGPVPPPQPQGHHLHPSLHHHAMQSLSTHLQQQQHHPHSLPHSHFLSQHHQAATYGHPHHHQHPLHHLSLVPPHHLRSEPQQTIPLSLSMNNHHTQQLQQSHSQNSELHASSSGSSSSTTTTVTTGGAGPGSLNATEEVTSVSSWQDKKKQQAAAVVTSLSCASSSSASSSPASNTRATPTSTNQKMEVDYEEQIHSNSKTTGASASTTTTTAMISPPTTTRNHNMRTYHSGEAVSSDNEDELMVDTGSGDSDQRMEDKNNNIKLVKAESGMKVMKGSDAAKDQHSADALDRKSTEEATSSAEIDSATDPGTPPNTKISKHMINGTTPDSYVSTSEAAEPTSRAQVLEELRARIRELEGSPFKSKMGSEEDHYRCYICKEPYKSPVISIVCWHVHCDECWISISDSKKTCPQCTIVTTTNDLRKIQV